jgi:hypothetical protein
MRRKLMVAKGGIEPPTQGFSGRHGSLVFVFNQLLATLAQPAIPISAHGKPTPLCHSLAQF